MSLKKLIRNKTMATLAVIFTAFTSTSTFAQQAAAAALAKPVDMTPIYKTIMFLNNFKR